MAASKVLYLSSTTSGAKASSQYAELSWGTFSRTTGRSRLVPSSESGVRSFAPASIAPRIHFTTFSRAEGLIIGPTTVARSDWVACRNILLHVTGEGVLEIVVDRLVNEDPLHADARLSRVSKSAGCDLRDRALPVAVGLHDHGRVAAEFEGDLHFHGIALELPAHGRAAGEAQHLDARVCRGVSECVRGRRALC